MEKVFSLSDQYVSDRVALKNAADLPLMRGLARWEAWNDLVAAHPAWKNLPATQQSQDLWVDEWRHGEAAMNDAQKAPTKALGLLRMLDGYLGGGQVGKAVSRLLQRSLSEPVSFEDFYQDLRHEARHSLPSLADFQGWIQQSGHPVLSTCVEGSRLKVEQRGFHLYPSETEYHNEAARWTVPLLVRFKDEKGIHTQRALLHPGDDSVALGATGKVGWAYANGNGMGWFRTQMPEGEREAMTRDLPKLSLAEQTSFAINQWRLVRHGTEPVGKFYDAVLAMRHTADPGLIDLIQFEMGTQQNWARPEDRAGMTRFLADVLRPAAEKFGYLDKPGEDPLLRSVKAFLLQRMCQAGDPAALKAAQDFADRWKKGESVGFQREILSADPQVLARLKPMAATELAAGKTGDGTWGLLAWPDSQGPAELQNLLNAPESKLPGDARLKLQMGMLWRPTSMDSAWKEFGARPTAEMLEALLVSPYREQVDKMLASGVLGPTLTAQGKAASAKGANQTLAHVSDQIHDFLVQRGYVQEAAPSEWLVAR